MAAHEQRQRIALSLVDVMEEYDLFSSVAASLSFVDSVLALACVSRRLSDYPVRWVHQPAQRRLAMQLRAVGHVTVLLSRSRSLETLTVGAADVNVAAIRTAVKAREANLVSVLAAA